MSQIYSMLPLLVLASLWIWGFHCLLSDGYLLGGLGRVLEKVVGSNVSKPIFTCPPCQSSIHGTAIFFTFGVGLDWYLVFIFVVCLVGLNFIIKEFLYE